MRFPHLCALALAGMLCLGADAPPTMQEIQQDFDAQKYQDVLKKVSQALQLKGNAGSGYDRAALFKLKGEAHLRMKQNAPASEAFTNAAKETTDPKEVGLCNATALLIKRSNNGLYQPKQATTKPATGSKPAPIDILPPDSRKDAMLALFNDESKAGLAKVDSLKKQKSLKPVMDGIRELATLRALELSATGTDASTRGALTDLGTHANQLMADALKDMSTKVEQLSTKANKTNNSQQTTPDGRVEVIITKQGLTSNEKAALKDIIATCKNIGGACDEFASALGSDGGGFSGTRSTADQVSQRADQVLNANYDPDIKSTGSVGVPGGTGAPRPRGRY